MNITVAAKRFMYVYCVIIAGGLFLWLRSYGLDRATDSWEQFKRHVRFDRGQTRRARAADIGDIICVFLFVLGAAACVLSAYFAFVAYQCMQSLGTANSVRLQSWLANTKVFSFLTRANKDE